ncbi:ATP-grasp domain-containing protein [Microbispora sp. NPDC088329]|uniref:ATP-grasp domain-containing protein n=1 Tax=Microbispora sp. NPDC088329 TaxID=3154869 RepID=UPI0034270245
MGTVIAAVVPNAAAGPADIARAAAARGHEPVFVAVAGAMDEQAKAVHTAFGPLVECDPGDPGDAIARLRRHRPCGVTTFSEGMLPLTTDLAAGLGLPFHDHDTTTVLVNKWAQRRRLAGTGVDAVASVVVTSRDEALAVLGSRRDPVVVKPLRSQSSQDTYLVEDPTGLPAGVAPSAERPFVLEEYLEGRDQGDFGDYVSVESLFAGGRAFTLGVTGKFPLLDPFREQGQFLPTHLPPAARDEVVRLASRAAEALGVRRGLVHTEIKLTPRGPRIIEVNGRLGGFHSELYRRGAGLDLLELGIAVACGEPVDPVPANPAGSVEFHCWNSPPAGGGVLRGADGADAVRREPGVIDYVQRVPLGRELPPSVMTFQLDFLRGSAPDHDTMVKTVDQCLAHLRFTFEEPDGAVRTWRASRGGLCALG